MMLKRSLQQSQEDDRLTGLLRNFTIRVPATSANMGPGYDIIAMALDIHNEFEITVGGKEHLKIVVEGEGIDDIPADENNLLYQALAAAYGKAHREIPNFIIKQTNRIPVSRGLGSSATAALAGVIIAKTLLGRALSRDVALKLAVEFEGHPDNVLAADRGGIVINYTDGRFFKSVSIKPPNPIEIALVIPRLKIKTDQARRLLPRSHTTADVVTNLRNVALLVSALHTGQYELLSMALDDKIHQPHRAKLLPGFDEAIEAAKKAGAYGAVLSGSGSSMVAFCRSGAEEISREMASVFLKEGIPCKNMATSITTTGVEVITGIS
jgi:homoserine kinase